MFSKQIYLNLIISLVIWLFFCVHLYFLLLFFSLDAKSSQITVTVKQGGLKLLQIHDNGTGEERVAFS